MKAKIALLSFLLVSCSGAQRATEARLANGAARWLVILDRQCQSGLLSRATDPKVQDVCIGVELLGPGVAEELHRLALSLVPLPPADPPPDGGAPP
jgi:hypothetical protein